MRKSTVFIAGLFLLLSSARFGAQADSGPVGQAKVSVLEGKAFSSRDEGKSFQPLKPGDMISTGALVKTDKGSRMELELPDGSFIRIAGNSQMKVNAVGYQPGTKQRDISTRLSLGKLWAKAKDIGGGRGGKFEVETTNAVTGVRGTIFRVNVDPNQATIVKVYQGSILLRSPREVFSPPSGSETRKEIAGPREVAPPQEISRAEWELLVKEMQEVSISPEGKASRPRRFSLEEDLDEWVKWNLERDKRE